ncbi:RNA-directed DNA polymerase, eukaryota, reverse transcriptase zinc-binding domain protein [Tanacetum coccineum]|uniref:RNA-directed DNA polymerase, eukaryota, reverse transcriptase zinc-binding domain protein n=1 Tax=Tanacetum coccineum TaxID=301880 RepID=A0ABQ4XIW3_9ASTR
METYSPPLLYGFYKFKHAQGDLAKKVTDLRKELECVCRIEVVEDLSGISYYGSQVGNQFVKHFQCMLGEKRNVDPILDPATLFINKLSNDDARFMVRPVLKEDIKEVIFCMADGSRPGWVFCQFFLSSWAIIGDEVCFAIQDFFKNGKLLKEVNDTIIALVPKSQTPQKVSDFRPISCCNILYKCISKLIANRIIGLLGLLVADNQSAFIHSRQISDNILSTHELMRNYHMNRGPSIVAFKIDIHKAYDSMEWEFLR